MNFESPSSAASPTPKFPELLVKSMNNLHDVFQAEIRYAQNKLELHANGSRTRAQRFNHGDQLELSTKNIKTARPSKKLDHKQLDLFPVNKVIGSHAYQLTLPVSMKIHPVFHVALLEPNSMDPIAGQVMPRPHPVEIEGHEEWEVEEVLTSRLYYRKPQ